MLNKIFVITILIISTISCSQKINIFPIKYNHNDVNSELYLQKYIKYYFKNRANTQIIQAPKILNKNSIIYLVYQGKEKVFTIPSDTLDYKNHLNTIFNKGKFNVSSRNEKIIINYKESISLQDKDWLKKLINKSKELNKGFHRIVFVGENKFSPYSYDLFLGLLNYLDKITFSKGVKISIVYDKEGQLYYTSLWLKK